jgi:hypothetical protein
MHAHRSKSGSTHLSQAPPWPKIAGSDLSLVAVNHPLYNPVPNLRGRHVGIIGSAVDCAGIGLAPTAIPVSIILLIPPIPLGPWARSMTVIRRDPRNGHPVNSSSSRHISVRSLSSAARGKR